MCGWRVTDVWESLKSATCVAEGWQILVKISSMLQVWVECDRSWWKYQVCHTCGWRVIDVWESLKSAIRVSHLVNFFNHCHCLTQSKKLNVCLAISSYHCHQKAIITRARTVEEMTTTSAQICLYECGEHKVTCNNSVLVLSSMSTTARSIFVILPNMAVICFMSAPKARMDSLILPHKQKVNGTRQC